MSHHQSELHSETDDGLNAIRQVFSPIVPWEFVLLLPMIFHMTVVLLMPARILALRDVCTPGDDGVSIDERRFENLSSADFVIRRLWERLTKLVCHLPKIGDGRLVVANEEMNVGIRLTFLVEFGIGTPVDVFVCGHSKSISIVLLGNRGIRLHLSGHRMPPKMQPNLNIQRTLLHHNYSKIQHICQCVKGEALK